MALLECTQEDHPETIRGRVWAVVPTSNKKGSSR